MKTIRMIAALLCIAALLAACGSSSAPAYDKAALEQSAYSGEFSQDISIRIDGQPAGAESVTLVYENRTGTDYTFTMVQRLEVLLDGTWYVVPDAQDFVTLQLLTLPANATVEDSFRFEGRYDPLPKGEYRILKDFSDPDGNSVTAAAAFTVD